MTDEPPIREERLTGSARDHLANERTMLAWVRTAVTIIGLGFLTGRLLVSGTSTYGWGVAVGALLVVAGGASAVTGLLRFIAVERQIDRAEYRPSLAGPVFLTATIAGMALLVLAYLLLAPPAP